jgi:hypothetical protein
MIPHASGQPAVSRGSSFMGQFTPKRRASSPLEKGRASPELAPIAGRGEDRYLARAGLCSCGKPAVRAFPGVVLSASRPAALELLARSSWVPLGPGGVTAQWKALAEPRSHGERGEASSGLRPCRRLRPGQVNLRRLVDRPTAMASGSCLPVSCPARGSGTVHAETRSHG